MNNKDSHFSKFRTLLEHLTLQGDDLQDIKKWWTRINSKMIMTLKSNRCLPSYQDLTKPFDPVQTLVPPAQHTQHIEGNEAYEQFSRELLDYFKIIRQFKRNFHQRLTSILQRINY